MCGWTLAAAGFLLDVQGHTSNAENKGACGKWWLLLDCERTGLVHQELEMQSWQDLEKVSRGTAAIPRGGVHLALTGLRSRLAMLSMTERKLGAGTPLNLPSALRAVSHTAASGSHAWGMCAHREYMACSLLMLQGLGGYTSASGPEKRLASNPACSKLMPVRNRPTKQVDLHFIEDKD